MSPEPLASVLPEATRSHPATPDLPLASALLPPARLAPPRRTQPPAEACPSLPAVAQRSAGRRSQDGRCAHGSCGGLEAEAEPSHSLTPRLQVFPHRAAADDPPRSCEAWCTNERRHRRAGAPSRPRRHPCSRHGGAAAGTAATARAGARVLPGGEVSARLQLQLGGSRVAREGGVGSSAARQVCAEHPDLRWREGRGAARSPVLCFRATPARARRPSSRTTPAFAVVLPGALLQTAPACPGRRRHRRRRRHCCSGSDL